MSFFTFVFISVIHSDILSVPSQHGCSECKLVGASLIGIAVALGLAASFMLVKYAIEKIPETLGTGLKRCGWMVTNLTYQFIRRYLSLITRAWNALGAGDRVIVAVIW